MRRGGGGGADAIAKDGGARGDGGGEISPGAMVWQPARKAPIATITTIAHTGPRDSRVRNPVLREETGRGAPLENKAKTFICGFSLDAARNSAAIVTRGILRRIDCGT
jgi:hypothetical protein